MTQSEPQRLKFQLADREAFQALLKETLSRLDHLTRRHPDEVPLQVVRSQLKYLEDWTALGRLPTAFERNRMNFGVIAARELSHIPELQQALSALAYFLDTQLPKRAE